MHPYVQVVEPVVIALLGAAALASAVVLALFVRPTTLFALAIGASVLSGNADRLGLPVSPDRILLLAGVGAMVLGVHRLPPARGERRLRPVEIGMILVLALAVSSAVAAGTLTNSDGFYGLLDRLGVLPFLAFAASDRIFGTDRDRRTLLGVLTLVGGYLACTAFFEIVGASALVFPKYINNPLIGTHWGRARGPFLEAGANGLALFVCGACATVGIRLFRTHAARVAAGCVAVACAVGVLLTLTRADWIGAVLGGLVGALLDPRARRRLVPVFAGGAVLVLVALVAVPGLATRASERAADEKPIWDRKNTDATALRIVAAEPVFGIGWNRFTAENADRARQADGYPLSQTEIGVHNVALAYAAELGLVGALLWLATLALGASAAWKGSASLASEWRALAFAILADWIVVANFSPLAYAFPNLCIWVFLGIAAAPTARRLTPAPQSASATHASATGD